MKAYTDLEQSKKLAKILPIESADFMWEYEPDKETYWDKPTMIPIDSYIFVNNIPCWSFVALVGILPRIDIEKEIYSDDVYDYRVKAYIDDGYVGDWFDNPVDACYEMILKLHELKLL